jgi:dUTP pyrophosphatase
MEELEVYVVRQDGVVLPEYATAASSGMDLRAHLDAPMVLAPLERALVPTGLAVSIPEGYEGEVRPRSGLAINAGITVLNAPGTIDADYRGEIQVILVNLGGAPFEIRNGDRIAQMVFKKVVRAVWEDVLHLPESGRGAGGFGSTGRK